MIVIGTKSIPLAALQMPADAALRAKTENVQELKADLKKYKKFLNEPHVRERDMRTVCGRDRIVAARDAGYSVLDVKLVDCTDEEAEELELVENFHRRTDPDEQAAQRRRYLDLLELRKAAEGDDEDPKRGRQKTPRGKAREELAGKIGVTPEALARQEQRRQPASAQGGFGWGEELEEAESEDLGPSIRAFGLDVPPTVDAQARRVQAVVDEIDTHLRAVAKLVNGLKETGASEHDASKAQSEYQRFAHAIRGVRPQALCPWCKGRINMEKCAGCYGTGFATKEKMVADLPTALLAEGEQAMVANGHGGFRLLASKVGPRPQAPPPRVVNGKKLTVLVPDGQGGEMKVDPETGEVLPF